MFPVRVETESLQKIFDRSLNEPILDLFSRPRKEVRSQLPKLGFELICESLFAGNPSAVAEKNTPSSTLGEAILASNSNPDFSANLNSLGVLMERLHAGSLIIDDIEDQSEVRRGQPCLHKKYGLEVALNSGCYLYFLALSEIERLSGVDTEIKWRMMDSCVRVLLEAHEGQAMDLSSKLDSMSASDIPRLCELSLGKKSGALMSLGLCLGAILAGANPIALEKVALYGRQLGVSLQKFDDLGNLKTTRPTPKHLEDLSLKRPSYVWWWAALQGQACLEEMRSAVEQLPETAQLTNFLNEKKFVEQSWRAAWTEFEDNHNQLALALNLNSSPAFRSLWELGERIAHAYE